MSETESPSADVDWPRGFEGARIANLLHFAGLTPEQKLQWLADMLELMQLAREARGPDAAQSTAETPPS